MVVCMFLGQMGIRIILIMLISKLAFYKNGIAFLKSITNV